MKIYYFSDDGRKFETEEECKKHDETIRIQNAKKEEREREEKEDWKIVMNKLDDFNTAYKKYNEKYGSTARHTFPYLSNLFDFDFMRF